MYSTLAKDNNLPVWVEIRNVVNGYPAEKILPFGRKLLEPSEVNVDASTAATATTFTFDSPVYLQQGVEYCVVVLSHSIDYRLWISIHAVNCEKNKRTKNILRCTSIQ